MRRRSIWKSCPNSRRCSAIARCASPWRRRPTPTPCTGSSQAGSRMLEVKVAQLHEDNREALSLAWVAGRAGSTAVRRESAAAAALIGHLNLTHPNSVQVIGSAEAPSLAGLVGPLFAATPAALVVADGVTPPPALLEGAEKSG